MSLVTIDRTRCRGDGICVAECPGSIIGMTKEGFAAPVPGAGGSCINCGHCVAVCPHDAISLAGMKPEDCLTVDRERLPGPDQLEHLLMSRRSIRSYRDRPVERAVLFRLVAVAGYAPTAKNLQPVNWLVIENKDEVRRLAGLVTDWMRFILRDKPALARDMNLAPVVAKWEEGRDIICRDAPHVVVAHAAKSERTGLSACTIALTYLEVAAFSMGLGACWAGWFGAAAAAFPPLVQALALPEGHQACGAMLIGYPGYEYHRIPRRKDPVITWR